MRTKAVSGFTLIEISIALVIIGLLMSSAFSMITMYSKGKMQGVTRGNLRNAEAALKSYLEMNGYYPCPASSLPRRNQEGFGRAIESCITPNEVNSSTTSIYGSDGVHVSEGRDGYKVRTGILPFRSLGIPDADALDGWGRLLQYAVTEKLTSYDTFDQKEGAIDVLADDKKSRITPPASMQYVVFSTGADGKGGYSGDGVPLDSCPPGLLESYNCDGDAVFMDAQSRLVPSGNQPAQSVDYDDRIVYQQYDPDADMKGGLVFFYRESCAKGFSEIGVDSSIVTGIDDLWENPAHKRAEEEGVRKLCVSSRYSAAILVQNQESGMPRPCPRGWNEIGYKFLGSDDNPLTTYKVCAR
jgi:prepilin-type N-terminal cleavage/methylation domain-containing protein